MKYKPGDEVLIKAEITDVVSCGTRPYFVKPDSYSINWVSEDKFIPMNKTYSDGLSDAWELAKKILYGNDKQLIEIFELNIEPAFFDLTHKREIINNHTPEEVLAKIEAYEKEKEIKVGDVVYYSDGEYESTKSIVTRIHGDLIYTVYPDGSCGQEHNPSELKKTGKHIDIESLLKQIGE